MYNVYSNWNVQRYNLHHTHKPFTTFPITPYTQTIRNIPHYTIHTNHSQHSPLHHTHKPFTTFPITPYTQTIHNFPHCTITFTTSPITPYTQTIHNIPHLPLHNTDKSCPSPYTIYYLSNSSWQFMDRDVTHKVVYGPKRSWGPYNILWVTDRSILPFGPKCHALFVILYSIHANLSDDMFLLLYIQDKKRVRTKSGRKHHIDLARSIY